MKFSATAVSGAYVISIAPHEDFRGKFARLYSEDAFREKGLSVEYPEWNCSSSKVKGTLRGLHYQKGSDAEAKLVRCVRGAIYDVLVDLRADSPSFRRWEGVTLREGSDKLLYVPAGCAHGYQTLEDNTEVFYAASARYAPHAEAGVRWDDSAFKISWPIQKPVLTEKDKQWSDFRYG